MKSFIFRNIDNPECIITLHKLVIFQNHLMETPPLVNKGDHNKLVHFKHFIIFSTLTFKQPHKPKSKKESMLGHAMMSQHDDATWCEV